MTKQTYQPLPAMSRERPYRPETDADPASRAMSAPEYRALIKKFNLTQEGAARFFGVAVRTGQRWALDGPHPCAAMVLRIMDWHAANTGQAMDPKEVEHIMRAQIRQR